MKIKQIFAGILLTFSAVLILSQVHYVQGQEAKLNSSVSPLTYIRGTVKYQFFQWTKPASSAIVKAEHVSTHKEYTAVVDKKGDYAIGVDKVGEYKVRAYDSKGTIFMPLVIKVNIIDKDVLNINFLGWLRF